MSDSQKGLGADVGGPQALPDAVIQDHDKWSIYREKSAQVGAGFVRWVEDPTMAYVTDIQAGGQQSGTKLLEWLKETTDKSLYAVGVVEDAQEFWDKMEERGLVDGQSDVPFMEFFGRGVRLKRSPGAVAVDGAESKAQANAVPVSTDQSSRANLRSNDLPEAIIANPLGAASEHKDYVAAKSGDVEAALRLAGDLVKDELVDRLRIQLGDEKPKLVPVLSIESSGRNRIPHAMAMVLSDKLGLDVVDDIIQANSPKRTAKDGIDRIFNSPDFDGPVAAGTSYLLVDDTITQGATFAGLAGHIRAAGGRVLGSVALTGKQYSAIIKHSQQTLEKLREQFADIEADFRAAAGHGFESLTESEARYLANFKPAYTIRDRIVAAGSQSKHNQDAGVAAQNTGLSTPPRFSEVVVYHGTRGGFTEFNPATISGQSINEFGAGFYFTPSRSSAELYAGRDGKVVTANLTLHNPKFVSTADRGGATGWHGEHDGVIVVYSDATDVNDPANWAEIVVASPSQIQIKSVTDLSQSKAEEPAMGKVDPLRHWMRNSKVVQANGDPLVVYHTSDTKDIRVFSGSGIFGQGPIYFNAELKAAKKAARGSKVVYPVYLRMENPVNTPETAIPWHKADDGLYVAAQKRAGHDGVYVKDEGGISIAVFNSNQIKSATDNDGQYNANYLDIRFSEVEVESSPVTSGQSREFAKWFGASKVVDQQGRPSVVYHGTNQDFTQFDASKIGSNAKVDKTGFFFTNLPYIAEHFAAPPDKGYSHDDQWDGANIQPVFLSLQNPVTLTEVLERVGMTLEELYEHYDHVGELYDDVRPEILELVESKGADGVLLELDGFQQIVVFDPTQIKSAIGNSGAYNPKNPDIRFSVVEAEPHSEDAVQTPAFAEWFGDSKVVDADGKPLVLYHGTTRNFSKFDMNADQTSGDVGKLGAFFTNSSKYACAYAENIKGETQAGGVVMPVFLAINNPKVESIEKMEDIESGYTKDQVAKYKAKLLRDGHDGILFQGNGVDEYVAFSPTQIKSATGNSGAYSPTDPDIRFSALEAEPHSKDAVQTPEFSEWFGNSRVVDDDGKPLVMYHGSHRDITEFDRLISTQWRPRSLDTVGSWFSDNPNEDGGAGMYASGENAAIYPVYLSISNPKYYATFNEFVDAMHIAEGRDPAAQTVRGLGSTEGLRAKLKGEGYDGIVFGKTYNQALFDKIIELQGRVANAKTAEFSVKRAERPPLTRARESLDRQLETLRSRAKGLHSTEFDKQKVYVAFEPEQIKSAIGNAGTFDRSKVDIRFSQVEVEVSEAVSTPEFGAWFDKSKVVGSDGEPLQVYHGTHADFNAFDFDKALDGAHWFTPMESHAASFGPAKGFYISLQNPMVIDQDDLYAAWDVEHPDGQQDDRSLLPRDFVDQFVAKAKAGGYDGLIIREMGDRDIESDMYLPFAAGQIKSASDNVGSFDASNPDVRFSSVPVTPSQARELAFNNWFDNSKIVGVDGSPLKVYHGSPSAFNAFDPHASMDGGFYFTPDRKIGESFSRDEDGVPVTLHEVYLSLQNPKSIDFKGEQQPSQEVMREIFDTAKSEGHDGAILHGVREFNGSGTQYVAFYPGQIKLATENNGSFDRSNPDVRFSSTPATLAYERSPAFKNWFDGSKVTDVSGEPLRVFHGTQASFSTFSEEMQGTTVWSEDIGFFFTNDPVEASAYAQLDWDKENPQPNVIPVYLAIKNPMVVTLRDYESPYDNPGIWYDNEGREAAAQAQEQGYDGLIVRDERGDMELANGTQPTLFVAFRPEQIKSAIGNVGTYDPNQSDIRHSVTNAVVPDARTTPAFKQWFGQSKAVDDEGQGIVVYRGEHGEGNGQPRTSLASITFTSDPQVASTYALTPNDMRNFTHAAAPKVIPAYLSIQNPIINNPDDPFVDFSDLSNKLGHQVAAKFARKFADHIEYTSNWEENFAPDYESVDALLDVDPAALRKLYMDAYPLLDDFAFVSAAKEAGFDGGIHVGNGASSHVIEYRVFSETQIKSALGNTGNFNARNPDIRASAADKKAKSVAVPGIASPLMATDKRPSTKLGLAGAKGVRDAVVAAFPSLERSVDLMLKRGKEGKRGGLVVVESDDPYDLALVYAKHTGRDFDVALETFGVAASKATGRSGVQIGKPFFDDSTAFVDLGQISAQLGPTAAMDALREFGEAIEDSSTWAIRYAKQFDSAADAVAAGVPLDDLYFDPQHLTDSPRWVKRIENAGFTIPHQGELTEQVDSMWGVRGGVIKLQGFADQSVGLTFVIAPNVSMRSAPAVVLHEVVHSQQRDDLDAKAQALLDSRATQQPGTREFLERVQARIVKARQVGNTREAMPYIVEQSVLEGRQAGFSRADGRFMTWVDSTIGPKVGTLVREFVAFVGATALKFGHIVSPTVDELVTLAKMGVVASASGKTMRGVGVQSSALVGPDVQSTGFFSALTRGVSAIKAKAMTGAMWLDSVRGLVSKGAVKQDEVEWTGLAEWLDLQTGKVSHQEITNYLVRNGVQVQEVTLGEVDEGLLEAFLDDEAGEGFTREEAIEYLAKEEGATPTKYSQYQLPGGENYREVLLTLPEVGRADKESLHDEVEREYRRSGNSDRYNELTKQLREAVEGLQSNSYTSSHWSQVNVLAHVRLNDRFDADGNRVLFVEELQSDWGQAGRTKGFRSGVEGLTQDEEYRFQVLLEDGRRNLVGGDLVEFEELLQRRNAAAEDRQAIPSAPFVVKTDGWVNLALKRIVKMAVDGGYDKVAFTDGDQNVDRYSLAKQIKSMHYRVVDGLYSLAIHPLNGGDSIAKNGLSESELEATVGKDIAKRIIAEPGMLLPDMSRAGKLENIDLQVGGDGMKVFYDKIVPNAVNALLKKLGGGRVERVEINQTSKYPRPFGSEAEAESWGNRNLGDHDFTVRGLSEAEGTFQIYDEFDHKVVLGDRLCSQPGFTITDAMRQHVAGGMPLFSKVSVDTARRFKAETGISRTTNGPAI